jgi:hypothetical protein
VGSDGRVSAWHALSKRAQEYEGRPQGGLEEQKAAVGRCGQRLITTTKRRDDARSEQRATSWWADVKEEILMSKPAQRGEDGRWAEKRRRGGGGSSWRNDVYGRNWPWLALGRVQAYMRMDGKQACSFRLLAGWLASWT